MKSTKQPISNIAKFTRNHKTFVKESNKHINRKTILSSKGRYRLPSSMNSLRLKSICQEAHKMVEEAENEHAKMSDIVLKTKKLKRTYRNDAKELSELPHTYLNDRRIVVAKARLKQAQDLLIAVTEAYKARTGKAFKPSQSEQVNKPIVLTKAK